MMPLFPLGSGDDLFVNRPDNRYGLRDPHIPPNVNMLPGQIVHRVVPVQPMAHRPPLTSETLAMPVPLVVPVVTGAQRRKAGLRVLRLDITRRVSGGARGVPLWRRLTMIRKRSGGYRGPFRLPINPRPPHGPR